MKTWRRRTILPALLVAVAGIAGAGPGAVRADEPQVLLQRYSCYLCHADREARTGPAFVEVAARYRGNAHAVAPLVATVTKGAHGSGPWHMPPHPEVSQAEAATMVRYILALTD